MAGLSELGNYITALELASTKRPETQDSQTRIDERWADERMITGINAMRSNKSWRMIQSKWLLAGTLALCIAGAASAQHQAIDFKDGMPFSNGYVTGKTLYVAGQQGPDSNGKVTDLDITKQTENTIAAIEKVVKKAGFQLTDIASVTVYITDLNDVPKMNEVYKKLMPNPKPARATVQVAGLIGGAKIEISAIAVKK